MIGYKMKLQGVKATERALKSLTQGIRNQILGPGLTESARVGVSASKKMLKRRRTGLLGRSMAYKVSPKRKDGGYRVIGADRGFKAVSPGRRFTTDSKIGATVTLSGKKRRGKLRTAKISRKALNVTSGLPLNPAKYAHLVEGGRKSNIPVKAKAMYFRVSVGQNAKRIFTKRVRAVKPQPFIKPASEYLKLRYPAILAKHLARVKFKKGLP